MLKLLPTNSLSRWPRNGCCGGRAGWGCSTVFWILRVPSNFSWIKSVSCDVRHVNGSRWFCNAPVRNYAMPIVLPVGISPFWSCPIMFGKASSAVPRPHGKVFLCPVFRGAKGVAGPSKNGMWYAVGFHLWSLCKGKFSKSGKLATEDCWGWWSPG